MTSLRDKLRRVALLSGWMVAAACAGDPMSPRAVTPAPEANAAIELSAAIAAAKSYFSTTMLSRAQALPADITVKKVIGKEGGTISIPSVGFELVVPAGAVTKNTEFAVTALAGNSIAYEFEPHGTNFKKELTFKQNGFYTTGWWNATYGGYFAGREHIDTNKGKANVSEVLPLRWDGAWLTFGIKHFSGYLVSCA